MRRLLPFLLLVLGLALPAHAAYTKKYGVTTSGAMTIIGNTLGFSKSATASGTNPNNPTRGTQDSIGAFTSTNLGLTAGNFPAGSTFDYTQNSSASNLSLPAGSTVLRAELIWGGSALSTAALATNEPAIRRDVTTHVNDAITFTTPAGSNSITGSAPGPSTVVGGGITYYVRSADVTSLVRASGSGTYICGGVPGTIAINDASSNACGWTLQIIYANDAFPTRNMTIFVGSEVTDTTVSTQSSISGFCTAPPAQGTLNARLLVSAIEGDVNNTGDTFLFGPTPATLARVSGPNNPLTNFFAAQINNGDSTSASVGLLSTTGVPNAPNHIANADGTGTNVSAGRQGWDITNIDVTSRMVNNQTTAVAQGTSAGDRYVISTLGLQLDVGAPRFPQQVKSVDKSVTFAGDTLTYSILLDNTTGSADALNVIFYDDVPSGTSFVPGSFTYQGVTNASAVPANGINLGTIPQGQTRTVTLQARVNVIPPGPGPAEFRNRGRWTYQFQSCAFDAITNEGITTNEVVTTAPRLVPVKTITSNDAPPPNTGDILTFTMSVPNNGTAATIGATLRDPMPASVSYQPGSTTLNGAAVADLGGGFPYLTPREIHSAGQGSGVIAIGGTATVVFRGVVNGNPGSVTNIAYADPDGGNPAPEQPFGASFPAVSADLGVAITDGVTSATAGAPLTYTVTVTNNAGGPTLNAFNLYLNLPAELRNPVYTPSAGTFDPATGNWTGSFAPGTSRTLTIAGQLSSTLANAITATAQVTTPPGVTDSNSANNTASDTDSTIQVTADLALTKTDNRTTVAPGGNTTYILEVTNNGPSTLSDITLVDTFPATLTNPVYTPSQGLYNSSTGQLTGLNLGPGQKVQLQILFTVTAGAAGTITNNATVSVSAGATDPTPGNNTASDSDTVGFGISGTVYVDTNANANQDNGESGFAPPPQLFVKLRPGAGGNATAVATVAADGSYSFAAPAAGSYTLILDTNNTLTDVTPNAPPGYINTEDPTGVRAITVTAGNPVVQQDFGLFNGSISSGRVFNDNGVGGGTANDGVLNGTPAGIGGVTIKATNVAGNVTYATTVTDTLGNYTLYIPASAGNGPIKIVETNLTDYLSTGAQVGTTGGTYDRPTDAVTFTNAVGTLYSGVNFGDIPISTLTNDGLSVGVPGGSALYPHVFTAGSAGSVLFSIANIPSPNVPGWSSVLYRDLNGDGDIDPTDTVITGPIVVTAGQVISLLVKEYIPATAQPLSQDKITLTAAVTYTGSPAPTLTQTLTRQDLTTVAGQPGLELVKAVDRTTAKSGDFINYTITYRNTGAGPLTSIVINDTTPAFTRFILAGNGALPSNLTGVTTQTPAVNATGALKWTFAGSLAPGQSGTVTFRVQLQ